MQGPLMYSAGVTWEDYAFTWEENDIEACLLDLLDDAERGDFNAAEVDALRSALRRVDASKISGKYEECRSRAAEAVAAANQLALSEAENRNPGLTKRLEQIDAVIAASDGSIDRELTNLFSGLKSPDAAQQRRFRAMYDDMGLATKSYREVASLLPALERAKVRHRRPPVPTPWTNEGPAMSEMRMLLAQEPPMTVAEAARVYAAQNPRPSSPTRAKRLESLYRQKAALRN